MADVTNAMNLERIRALVTVPDEEMLPPPDLFLHRSMLHGLAHVGRVLVHAMRLVEATGFVEEMPRLWAAVYLHDIARRHDGTERGHGANAWARLPELPAVRALLERGGVREEDLPAIAAAVTRHSNGEAREGEPHGRLIELLKDADGLDRVRLYDLDVRYLRTPAARTMRPFAEQLFEETTGRCPQTSGHFACLWKEALRLAGEGRHTQ